MLPEGFIRFAIRVEIRLHIVQKLRSSVLLDEGRDIIVSSRRITRLRVATVAIVGPEAMDAP